jgi:hypothetical protein
VRELVPARLWISSISPGARVPGNSALDRQGQLLHTGPGLPKSSCIHHLIKIMVS